jgi:hypothetical protein
MSRKSIQFSTAALIFISALNSHAGATAPEPKAEVPRTFSALGRPSTPAEVDMLRPRSYEDLVKQKYWLPSDVPTADEFNTCQALLSDMAKKGDVLISSDATLLAHVDSPVKPKLEIAAHYAPLCIDKNCVHLGYGHDIAVTKMFFGEKGLPFKGRHGTTASIPDDDADYRDLKYIIFKNGNLGGATSERSVEKSLAAFASHLAPDGMAFYLIDQYHSAPGLNDFVATLSKPNRFGHSYALSSAGFPQWQLLMDLAEFFCSPRNRFQVAYQNAAVHRLRAVLFVTESTRGVAFQRLPVASAAAGTDTPGVTEKQPVP